MIFDNCYGPGHVIKHRELVTEFEKYNALLRPLVRSRLGDDRALLIMTFDTEVFPRATRKERDRYPAVLAEMASSLAARGFGATFCVQLRDSMPISRMSPPEGLRKVADILGKNALGLHCLDHVTKNGVGEARTYDQEYFGEGISGIEREYGATPAYFSQPSWVMTANSATNLSVVPQIKAARGIQSGPSFWKSAVHWTLRFPYLYHQKVYFPYQYVDWNFSDYFGRRLAVDVLASHEKAAAQCVASVVFMETLGHPFRLAVGNVSQNIKMFRRSLEIYRAAGVRILGAAEAIKLFEGITKEGAIPDWADLLPDLRLSGSELPVESPGKLPAKRTLRNGYLALQDIRRRGRRRLSTLRSSHKPASSNRRDVYK